MTRRYRLGPPSITLSEAAEAFLSSPRSLLTWVKSGHLAVFIPHGRVVWASEEGLIEGLRIHLCDWEAFVRSRAVRPGEREGGPPENPLGRFWEDVEKDLVAAPVAPAPEPPRVPKPPRLKVRRVVPPRPRPPGGKVPPFGWKVAPDTVTLLPVAAEQNVIGRILALRALGRTDREIAAELTARGLKRRGGETVWGPGAVRRILSQVDEEGVGGESADG